MTAPTVAPANLQTLFPGDGEMAQRCRAFDWSATSLGAPSGWSPALRMAVRTMLESPFATLLWCGPELVAIYNDAYIAILGAKHPRALGRPGNEVWAEIWPDISGMFERIRAGGGSTFAEDSRFMMERAEGPLAEAWFTFALSPVREDDGSIVAFLNIAAETTRRVRDEQRMRALFEQAPAFLAVLHGPRHVFEFANDAYMQLVGHRDVIGRTVVDALPELRDQGFVDLLDRVYETGAPHVGRETPVMLWNAATGADELVYLDFVYQPLADAEGKRIGIVAHGSNVTEAVVARREIESLLARYTFLAESIPVQVWTTTPDGALDYVSTRTATLLGRRPEELVGAGWTDVLHPGDVDRTLARWRQSLATGEPYETEYRMWSAADRAYRWHLARAVAQRDERGEVLRWFGTNTDIEDAKRANAELQRLTDEAMEANRAKGDFLAAMSHELRTPLNAIGGYAQLLELGVRGPISDAQRDDLGRIQRAKNHLDRLVSDVLNFAKLGAGRIELRLFAIDVAQITASVVDMIAPQLAEKSLVLAPITVSPGLAVTADADKARQILVNLLANALKFTPAGGTIAVVVDASETTVTIAVSDTGVGIPESDLERIFEPFVQAKHALRPSDQGVGLGLAISRQLARAMDGDLTATSTPAVGSTFTLTLPRAHR